MARPERARRLTDEEGRTLLRLVRRGRHATIKVPYGDDDPRVVLGQH